MPKLFMSFTELLLMMKGDQIEEADLDGALFYFGCERCHVFDATENTEAGTRTLVGHFGDNPELGVRLHELVRTAVLGAIRDGRAEFRRRGRRQTPQQLNRLLERNGYKPLTVPKRNSLEWYNHFCGTRLRDNMATVNPELTVPVRL